MLSTLYTIGEEVSRGRDIWEDIIACGVIPMKDGIDYLVLNVVFDLDEEKIIISGDNLESFDDSYESLKDLMLLKTLGRNIKFPYLCVESKKIGNLFKSLFGKPNKKGDFPEKGELAQAIENDFPELTDSPLFSVLQKLVGFKREFERKFKNSKGKFTLDGVNETLELSKKSRIVLLYPSIKSKALSDFDGYKTYLKKKYVKTIVVANKQKKLCYASGTIKENIQGANFSGRYNINKFFVRETRNYASNFKDFDKSYQISQELQTFLDRGSNYILNHLVTTIADIRHVVIPQFLDVKRITSKHLKGILSDTDLLFNSRKLSELEAYFQRKNLAGAYWLNFLAIDSDGNYFKAGNLIKDVSKFHFVTLLKTLADSGELFSPWLGKKHAFNFNRMYRLIPVRKDKENINQALILFAAVLEGRKIELKKIYQHFTELILCHWYERYKSFTNVQSYYSDFDYAVKYAVFGYLAFVNTLRQLDLLKNISPMENEKRTISIAEDIMIFFDTMEYQPDQQALFYLGKALNQAAYAQQKKGNKKAVLEKINFNGMDERSIYRLSTDLFEKAKQYDILEKMQWNLAEFNRRFDFNNWNMNPQEALFFILSGYTYGIKSSTETITHSDSDNQ